MKAMLAAFIGAAAASPDTAGFTNLVRYSFTNATGLSEYLAIIKPSAEYVAEQEPTTWTFRPFAGADGKSMLLVERYPDQAAHDTIHEASAAHQQYLKQVAAWNASNEFRY